MNTFGVYVCAFFFVVFLHSIALRICFDGFHLTRTPATLDSRRAVIFTQLTVSIDRAQRIRSDRSLSSEALAALAVHFDTIANTTEFGHRRNVCEEKCTDACNTPQVVVLGGQSAARTRRHTHTHSNREGPPFRACLSVRPYTHTL